MARFRRRQPEIVALRYDGTNDAALAAAAGWPVVGGVLRLRERGDVPIAVGSWLVVDEQTGYPAVYSPAAFAAAYEPLSQPVKDAMAALSVGGDPLDVSIVGVAVRAAINANDAFLAQAAGATYPLTVAEQQALVGQVVTATRELTGLIKLLVGLAS